MVRTAALVASLLGTLTTPQAESTLSPLDPATLAPRPPVLELGEYHGASAVSPDGTQVALAISASPATRTGGRVGIRIVDLATLSFVRDVQAGIVAEALAWPTAGRILAVLQSGDVVRVDSATGRVVARRRLSASLQCGGQPAAEIPGVLVSVLARDGRPRPLRLVIARASGPLRTVVLDRVRMSMSAVACSQAGVAVDPAGHTAFVVAAGMPVATVELAIRHVSYDRLNLGPATRCPHGAVCSHRREAQWLAPGRLAVTGEDMVRPKGRRLRPTAAGLRLIDTITGRSHLLMRSALGASVGGGTLFAWGNGLRAYDRAGRLRYRVATGERVDGVQVVGDRAYVLGSRALRVTDARSGRLLSQAPPLRSAVEILHGGASGPT